MKTLKKIVLAASLAVSGLAQAGLVGNTVTCAQVGPSSNFTCSAASAVVGAGVEFVGGNDTAYWSLDFSNDQFVGTALESNSLGSTIFEFTNLTAAFNLAIFGGQTGMTGFDASDITLDNGTLRIDMRNTVSQQNASFSIRLAAGGQQVPEPGSLALLGLGLVGLAAARRRKQA
jgi:hypothetical protein